MAKQKGRWFRFYSGALDDPKALMLSDPIFRTWVGLMCIASKEDSKDGRLPDVDYLAIALRIKPADVEKRLVALERAGMLDPCGDYYKLHNWDIRQFESDGSTKRVQAFRERAEKRFMERFESVSVSDSVSVSSKTIPGKDRKVRDSLEIDTQGDLEQAHEDWHGYDRMIGRSLGR